jgi:hypothetical protein
VPVAARTPDLSPHPVYRWLATQPPDVVVLELPTPSLQGLWLHEATYEYNQIYHWRALVNGYSGFAPQEYLTTIQRLQAFPDEQSIGRLRQVAVDYVFVHREYLDAERYTDLVMTLAQSPDFDTPMTFGSGMAEVRVFRLRKR